MTAKSFILFLKTRSSFGRFEKKASAEIETDNVQKIFKEKISSFLSNLYHQEGIEIWVSAILNI